MNKLITVILAVVAFVIVGQATKFGIREYREYSNHANFKKKMIEAVEELNNKTPIILDRYTKIIEVKVEGDVVIYSATRDGLDYETVDLSRLSKSQLITNLFYACQNDESKSIINNGFDIEYEYFFPSKRERFSNRITEKDCQPFFGENISKLAERFIELQLELIPIKLDSETNLINIKRSNNSIELVYELVNYKKEELDLNVVKEVLEKHSAAKNCAGPDSKFFLDNGINFIDTFVDKSGLTIYSFETNLSKC